jgi:hypothetical protein
MTAEVFGQEQQKRVNDVGLVTHAHEINVGGVFEEPVPIFREPCRRHDCVSICEGVCTGEGDEIQQEIKQLCAVRHENPTPVSWRHTQFEKK